MTDFRPVCGLRVYSGGTVPDSNRIHYSPLSLYDISGTEWDIKFSLVYAFSLSNTSPDKKENDGKTVVFFGGDKRDRTADLLTASQALSQLSYTPKP